MKRLTLISLALLLAMALSLATALTAGATADGPWVYSTNLPGGINMVRFDAEYHNGKMYLLGYRADGAGATDGSVWVYDVAANTWSDTGVDMPVPVSNYTIAKLSDANGVGLYLFGGRDGAGNCITEVQVYYPASNTTAVVATDPWSGNVGGVTTFPGTVEVVDNKAYAWGGFCGTTPAPYTSNQTFIFDPMAAAGSRWTAGPNLPSPGAYQTGAVLDGKVYSLGGDTFDGSSLFPYADVLMLDPADLGAGWQAKAPIPIPSSGVPGCDETRAFGFDTGSPYTNVAGKIVLAGCGQWPEDPTVLPDSFIYTGATDTWATFEALNQARRNHAGAFIVDSETCGRMWVGGGYIPGGTNVGTNTAETYQVCGSGTAVALTAFDAGGASNIALWAATSLIAGMIGLALFSVRSRRAV
jgi:hypothetical protein